MKNLRNYLKSLYYSCAQELKDTKLVIIDIYHTDKYNVAKMILIFVLLVLCIFILIVSGDVTLFERVACDSSEEATERAKGKQIKIEGSSRGSSPEPSDGETRELLDRLEKDAKGKIDAGKTYWNKENKKGTSSLLEAAAKEVYKEKWEREEKEKQEKIEEGKKFAAEGRKIAKRMFKDFYYDDKGKKHFASEADSGDMGWYLWVQKRDFWDAKRARMEEPVKYVDHEDLELEYALQLSKEQEELERALRASRQETTRPGPFDPSSSSTAPVPLNPESPQAGPSTNTDDLSKDKDNVENKNQSQECDSDSSYSVLSSLNGNESPNRYEKKIKVLQEEEFLEKKSKK